MFIILFMLRGLMSLKYDVLPSDLERSPCDGCLRSNKCEGTSSCVDCLWRSLISLSDICDDAEIRVSFLCNNTMNYNGILYPESLLPTGVGNQIFHALFLVICVLWWTSKMLIRNFAQLITHQIFLYALWNILCKFRITFATICKFQENFKLTKYTFGNKVCILKA